MSPDESTELDEMDGEGETDGTEAMVGEYANYVSVGSTQTEFYLDFFHVVPGSGDGDHVLPVRRLLISPMLVRGLVRALEEEIGSYESTFNMTLPTVQS